SGLINGPGQIGVSAFGDVTVTNAAGGIIGSDSRGIQSQIGAVNVTNDGSIIGLANFGIIAKTNATVANTRAISGDAGIQAGTFVNVSNSTTGIIFGTGAAAIFAGTNATVTSNNGNITGATDGVRANSGIADVTSSGIITGSSGFGIFSGGNA